MSTPLTTSPNWLRLSWPSRVKAEIVTAGLDSDAFYLDDPTLVVHRSINELVYDTLGYIVEPESVAYGYLLGTDVVSDRDGRRALVDLIKGCVPPADRQNLQAEHSSLTYPAKADPRPILAKEQRLVRGNKAADWTPTVPRLRRVNNSCGSPWIQNFTRPFVFDTLVWWTFSTPPLPNCPIWLRSV
ncbi:hypothetical protein CYMTET_35434 [Cymbomonas tetramitiformis]|uniref:Uncharacterized protein n=1 Tax=Cymbomonas tetramitiformis TaxID=36881 RepID=A0AAE0KP70_9CHLO|nr:hypothetical protein CYMTET_35434 [Cymbomonas tetramitiformis]